MYFNTNYYKKRLKKKKEMFVSLLLCMFQIIFLQDIDDIDVNDANENQSDLKPFRFGNNGGGDQNQDNVIVKVMKVVIITVIINY